MNDTDRLSWIAENSCAIRKEAEKSADPYYFIIYKGGCTSSADNDFRRLIDHEISISKKDE